ncbi:MAG: GHKL domain-containing protein [Lachnospiraceae bacterium]|nr:GHKL domain-containing protein [Lachnospiraceae bacterium]
MEILVLCGIYVAELVCYQLGLRILFQVRQRTWVWMVVGILLPVGIGVLPSDDAVGKNLLITIATMGIMVVSIDGRAIEKAVRLVLTFLLIECINAIFVPLRGRILEVFDRGYADNLYYLAVRCCAVMIILLFNVVKEKLNSTNKTHINSLIYFIIGIIAISMLFCLRFLNFVIGYLHYSNYIIFCSFLDVAILFSIVFLVVFVIYIKNTHERMEVLLKTEKLLKEAQVNYYKQALKKEIDTRKYRHDMVSHLIYVQDILSRHKVDDAQRYLASILGGFKKIQSTYYVVGNEMVDTIMNYFFGMLSENVSIDIKGKCPVSIEMEDTDICTIFSNLLQNVVEEINDNEIENAQIIIEVQKGKQYVEYKIKNTLHSEIKEGNEEKFEFPISHKQDKKNHGIGMVNVKSAIERNHGKFEWYQEGGYFCVSVVLPIKNEYLLIEVD